MLVDDSCQDLHTHARLIQVLDAAAARWADGEKKRLSLMLGLGAKAIDGWGSQGQKPAFPLLLQIAEALGVTVRGLFDEPLPERPPCSRPDGLLTIGARSKQHMSLPALATALHAQLEGPESLPVSSILARLGVTRSYAKYWLPELLEQLSQKHQHMRALLVCQRRVEEINVAERVFREVEAGGNYPSIRRMSQALRPHGLSLQRAHLRNKYKVWRERLAAKTEA